MQTERRFGPNWRIYGLLLVGWLSMFFFLFIFFDIGLAAWLFASIIPLISLVLLLAVQTKLYISQESIVETSLLFPQKTMRIRCDDIEWLALDKVGPKPLGREWLCLTQVIIKNKAGGLSKIMLSLLENQVEAENYFRVLISKMVEQDTQTQHDLLGVSQLARDATLGLTDLVEAMQQHFTRLPGMTETWLPAPISGLSKQVFKSLREVTGLTGQSMDGLLAQISPLLVKHAKPGERAMLSPERAAVLSALNGVLGDYLAENNNALTLNMRLRRHGHSLELTKDALSEAVSPLGERLVILVHGLCMNDLQWHRQGHDHGEALEKDFAYTPLYLRYNTGQHISKNGQAFADLLEVLVKVWPVQVKQIVLIGHSMGGLVSRSACYYGQLKAHKWLKKTQKLVCLGSPHHGAPLERGGNWVDVILGSSPYTAPLAKIGKVRSSGITDLRYGNVIDAHWQGRDRFERAKDSRLPVPLPAGIECYAMAGTTGKKVGDVVDQLLGDGLVQVDSALGRHKNSQLDLAFPSTHQWLGYGVNHMDLLNDSEAYAQLRIWLT